MQKTTLLDFPGKVSAILFTQGCDFACPYCHNPELVPRAAGTLAVDEALAFLRRRRGVLQGVVLTGGEPTLHAELPDLCRILRTLGYAVKLDSNGGAPDRLAALLAAGLVDYVAMDVKADPAAYPRQLCARPLDGAVARSMALLEASGVPHEFRVPGAAPFVTETSFARILDQVRPGTPVFLQKIRLDNVLAPAFFRDGGRALEAAELAALAARGQARGHDCRVR